MGVDIFHQASGARKSPRSAHDPRQRRKQPSYRDSTDEYREEIASALLRLGLYIGAILLVPAFVLGFRDGDYAFIAICGLAYASLVGIRIGKPLSGPTLFLFQIGILFFFGSYLVLRFGSASIGQTWLCASTMLATVFFGMRGAVVSCAAQAGILAAIGVAEGLGLLSWRMDALMYSNAAIDGIGLGIFTGAAQFYLVGGLRRSIEARGRLVSELSRRQEELKRESAGRQDAELRADFLERHDPLTRLPNRESFELELARAIDVAEGRGRILGVMAVGVDRFKRVGETHGPGAGDAVLIDIGVRLSRSFREDDLVARSSGDVFLVMLSDVKSPEDAKDIIEKSRRAFDRSFSVGGSDIGLSASFGLALFPNDGLRAEGLIRAAEAALRLSKDDGPGSYRLYDASLHSRLIAKALIEQEIRGALRVEAFLPWYQPKVDILGRIVGAEALARWSLPGGGFRQPVEFIAAAERSGNIGDLGRIVLAKACAAAAAWERKGLEPIPVSVNLSPYQFRSDELVKDVRRILAITGLPPSRLDLEITESGIMEDQSGAIEKMAQLKALGCSISIDDFGTGYSSFSTLRDFPADSVKLPQAFVEPLPRDKRATTIAGAVIDLAHRLNFAVVAEGVENQGQFAWLGDAKCDQYQGFLFARPMPEADFEQALEKGLAPTLG